ncbi:Uncharacterized protein TCM_006643 [Theobroma cacao]|uniref:Uncharacterized protein n=1 Tax=Theobroma cacao TaxID=3641 RepID=A0A061DYF4_THECC|nr:Uncharacterized protein TCM_006643 [Theobroma cacao]
MKQLTARFSLSMTPSHGRKRRKVSRAYKIQTAIISYRVKSPTKGQHLGKEILTLPCFTARMTIMQFTESSNCGGYCLKFKAIAFLDFLTSGIGDGVALLIRQIVSSTKQD